MQNDSTGGYHMEDVHFKCEQNAVSTGKSNREDWLDMLVLFLPSLWINEGQALARCSWLVVLLSTRLAQAGDGM